MTTGGGSIVERYAYDAYGEPTITNGSGVVQTTSSENNRYLFTGREWDEDLSLYHYRWRMYDPKSGRFLGRDPIGFLGSLFNQYEYAESKPLIAMDPHGLKCTYHYYMADFFNLEKILDDQPEFDKCDRVAPACCWIKDGQRVCKEHFNEDDIFIPRWPQRGNRPLPKNTGGAKFMKKLFEVTIPGNMQTACKNSKCDCGGKFSARIVCDTDMREFLGDAVDAGILSQNPCDKTFTWDCAGKSWDDPAGVFNNPIEMTQEEVDSLF